MSKKMERPPLWLIWSVSTNGVHSLRAVCTTQPNANRYRKYIGGQYGIVDVRIEKVTANHLFGEGMYLEQLQADANQDSGGTK